MSLYSKMAGPVPEMDFNKEIDTIDATILTHGPQTKDVDFSRLHTQIREAVTECIAFPSAQKKAVTCIITVPLISTRNPYRLDIREDN